MKTIGLVLAATAEEETIILFKASKIGRLNMEQSLISIKRYKKSEKNINNTKPLPLPA